jgi:hypothetical protein
MQDITESEINRFFRKCLIIIIHLFILFAMIIFSVQIFILAEQFSFNQLIFTFILIALLIPTAYIRKRIARIAGIDDRSIVLISARGRVYLEINEIVKITKLVRFTFSERPWYMIAFLNSERVKERWLFQGEPRIDLLEKIKAMGIRLRNIP